MAVSTFASTFGQVANERTLGLGLYQPPPDSTTTTRPWFAISNPGGLNAYEDAQENVVGHPFDAVRLFHGSFVADPRPLLQPYIDMGKAVIYSTKPPLNPDSQYPQLAANLEALGGQIYASVNHEPENDTPADQFAENYLAFYEALKDVPNVTIGPIYMLGTMTSSGAQAAYRPFIDVMPLDWLGVDGYNPLNRRTFSQMFNVWALKARERNVPWIIAEWSTHGTPTQRAVHVEQARTFWENPVNADLHMVSWFDSDGGPRAGPSGWRMNRALPDDWAVIDGIAQAVNPPPEYVTDEMTPAAIYDALQTERRNLGPVAPPPPPDDTLQRGAVDWGDAEYTIPEAAVYVSPTGNDQASGLVGAPFRTVTRAIGGAGTGGTVVLRAGTFRERVVCNTDNVTFQNYPGEAAELCGSDVVTAWTQVGSNYRTTVTFPEFKHDIPDNGLISGSFPLAGWPYQVWRDSSPLTHVATLGELTAGEFFVEEHGNSTVTYWVRDNPTGHLMEVTARQEGLICNRKATVRGLRFRHYGSSTNSTSTPHIGACRQMADHGLWENCHFLQNSAAGLHLQNHSSTTVRLCTFDGNGQMGLRGFKVKHCVIEQNHIVGNNRKRFAPAGAAGGMKIDTDCIATDVRYNLCENNRGHGLWLDIYCHFSAFTGNICHDNDDAGLFYELSVSGAIIGNIVTGGIHGILVSEAQHVRVYNNTILDSINQIIVQSGGRMDVDTVTVRNNLIGMDTPPAGAVALTGIDAESPGDVRDINEMNVTFDNNAVWRRTTSPKYGRITMGGGRPVYDTLAAFQTGTGQGANSLFNSGSSTNPYFDADYNPDDSVIGLGVPLHNDDADRLGWDTALRSAPALGAIQP